MDWITNRGTSWAAKLPTCKIPAMDCGIFEKSKMPSTTTWRQLEYLGSDRDSTPRHSSVRKKTITHCAMVFAKIIPKATEITKIKILFLPMIFLMCFLCLFCFR